MDGLVAVDTPEEATFRAEVRAWLKVNASEYAEPPAVAWEEDELVRRARDWQRRKAKAGYGALSAPKEAGGAAMPERFQAIFDQEEARYHTPHFIGQSIGLNMAMAVVSRHGTTEQVRRFLSGAVAGDESWCQRFSEPAAGSDLAGVRTKATRDGDNWIVNGQKVWSSWAHHARYGILLARTDPKVVKH